PALSFEYAEHLQHPGMVRCPGEHFAVNQSRIVQPARLLQFNCSPQHKSRVEHPRPAHPVSSLEEPASPRRLRLTKDMAAAARQITPLNMDAFGTPIASATYPSSRAPK